MIRQIKHIEIILYVNDQKTSCEFYEKLFRKKADLNVPGMSEFIISDSCKLGLMPNKGIAKILNLPDSSFPSQGLGKEKNRISPHTESVIGIPRCELYLNVEDIKLEYENALSCGAKLISAVADRDWGDSVCYFSDPDGHIIAFAERSNKSK